MVCTAVYLVAQPFYIVNSACAFRVSLGVAGSDDVEVIPLLYKRDKLACVAKIACRALPLRYITAQRKHIFYACLCDAVKYLHRLLLFKVYAGQVCNAWHTESVLYIRCYLYRLPPPAPYVTLIKSGDISERLCSVS